MFNKFLEQFNAPKECLVDKVVAKKMFLEHTNLDVTDKKALKTDIEKIKILYSFNTQNINISRFTNSDYDYMEIAVLHVTLSSDLRVKRIAEFINKAIPYPLVILFTFKDSLAMSIADKRLNKADSNKVVLEDVIITDFINLYAPTEQQKSFLDDFIVTKMPFTNFYLFYQGFKNKVISLQSASRNGIYSNDISTQDRLNILNKIEQLEEDIISLKYQYKKESIFSEQMNLNVNIKQKEQEIKSLEKAL